MRAEQHTRPVANDGQRGDIVRRGRVVQRVINVEEWRPAGTPSAARSANCKGTAGALRSALEMAGPHRQNDEVSDADIEDFLRRETEVWRALVDGDGLADARLLSGDFLGVYPTGFADRSDHVSQLDDGPTIAAFELSEERLLALSDSVVLLAYRADFRRRRAAEASDPQAMYVSSLWCRRDDRWVNVFSQDTPTPATGSTSGRRRPDCPI